MSAFRQITSVRTSDRGWLRLDWHHWHDGGMALWRQREWNKRFDGERGG